MKLKSTPDVFAAIDLGSNAVRLTIAQLTHNQLKVVKAERVFFRLGQDVFAHGQVSETSLVTLTQIFTRFNQTLAPFRPVALMAVATSAMRDAANQKDVVGHLYKHTGIELQVISGEQEAAYLAEMLAAHLEPTPESQVLADLGGGSLEVSGLVHGKLVFQQSFDCGALRLAKLNDAEQRAELAHIATQLQPLAERLPYSPSAVVLTGGNAKVLARLAHHMMSREGSVPQLWPMSWEQFHTVYHNLQTQSVRPYIEKGVMQLDHADVILPAMALFECIGHVFSSKAFLLLFLGLKESLLFHQALHFYPQRPFRLSLG